MPIEALMPRNPAERPENAEPAAENREAAALTRERFEEIVRQAINQFGHGETEACFRRQIAEGYCAAPYRPEEITEVDPAEIEHAVTAAAMRGLRDEFLTQGTTAMPATERVTGPEVLATIEQARAMAAERERLDEQLWRQAMAQQQAQQVGLQQGIQAGLGQYQSGLGDLGPLGQNAALARQFAYVDGRALTQGAFPVRAQAVYGHYYPRDLRDIGASPWGAEAEERAKQLLFRLLTETQRSAYESTRYFKQEGPEGRWYKLGDDLQVKVYERQEDTNAIENWCAFLPNTPSADTLSAQLLLIRSDPSRLRSQAVVTNYRVRESDQMGLMQSAIRRDAQRPVGSRISDAARRLIGRAGYRVDP